ncbi:hypothetical protein ACLKA7_000914 [Drosophila subpalustris]
MKDYIYRDEVNISQNQFSTLLKAAESLQIKGKVRHPSMENDVHDNSNSSVLQAVAAYNQSVLQQTSASLRASALVSTQLAKGSSASAAVAPEAAIEAACGSSNQVLNQPLSSSSNSVVKETEHAKLTSTATQGAQQHQQQRQAMPFTLRCTTTIIST